MTEKEISDRFTFVKSAGTTELPDAHIVGLKVEQQSFVIAYETDTKDEAEWMRKQLTHALCKLVQIATKGETTNEKITAADTAQARKNHHRPGEKVEAAHRRP